MREVHWNNLARSEYYQNIDYFHGLPIYAPSAPCYHAEINPGSAMDFDSAMDEALWYNKR